MTPASQIALSPVGLIIESAADSSCVIRAVREGDSHAFCVEATRKGCLLSLQGLVIPIRSKLARALHAQQWDAKQNEARGSETFRRRTLDA